MIYTITFNPALDYLMVSDKFEIGNINRSKSEHMFFGGKGINVSTMLQRLGVKTMALGFVAGFTGEQLCAMLDSEGIPNRFIRLESGITRINVKIRADQETDINALGPKISKQKFNEILSLIGEMEKDDIICISGSAGACDFQDGFCRLLETAAEREIRCVVDVGGKELQRLLKFNPFLIKPNREELEEFFGKKIYSIEDVRLCAFEMQRMGARNVLVSLGADGAMLLDEIGGVYRALAVSGNVINTVGAGDSMVAGFLFGYLNKGSMQEGLRYGVATGSATAFSLQLASAKQVFETAEKIKVL